MIFPNSSGGNQPALRAHRVGELLPGRNRLASDLTRRIHVVLRLQRLHDLRNRDVQLRQLIRLHPDAHRVLPRAENLIWRYPGHARQFVHQVDVGVIRQEHVVVRALRRIKRRPASSATWAISASIRPAVFTCAGNCDCACDVRNCVSTWSMFGSVFTSKSTVICVCPLFGVDRVHVIHVVDAADLCFERRRHRLLQRLRVRAGIRRRDLNFRRHDARELRHRQRQHRHAPHNHHQNGDHHRDDRSSMKNFDMAYFAPTSAPAFVSGFGFTADPVPHLRGPFGNDAIPGLEAAADDPHGADAIADIHTGESQRGCSHRPPLPDSGPAVLSQPFAESAARSCSDSSSRGFAELPWPQHVPRIREFSDNPDRPRLAVHLAICEYDPSPMRVDRIV